MTAVIVQTTSRKKISLPAHLQRMPQARPPAAKKASRPKAAAPAACVNAACSDPLSGHVTFDAGAGDFFCAICGEYQAEIDEEHRADG